MIEQNPFKWRHFQTDIILLCVRWYLRYALSYRDLEEIMLERGLHVDHTTIYRWVQEYASELERRCRPYVKPTNDSWRVDETYIKVKKQWVYLYRAADSKGNTLDFFLSSRFLFEFDTRCARRNALLSQDACCLSYHRASCHQRGQKLSLPQSI
ncbi:hypothetical protein KSB_91960 [Ktedonobacter robiniae]|uniref:DDE domain-containing protein n=1 Tax=Ktedonobacter robiniae TaxID=2778365 RepID=A0ABQ3V6X6_9CHLR|nr:hypothetical protein KSB_91960 [Ktedonobacter robiniae]